MAPWDETAFLDRLYGAALEPSQWVGVMEAFADRIGGDKGWLSQLDQKDGTGGGVIARIDPAMPELYAAHYGRCNPLFATDDPQAFLKAWRPRILTDEDWMPKADLLRSEYYNDFLRPQGIHSALMIRLAVNGTETASLNITRPLGRGQFDGEDLEIAAALHPHLIRAFDLSRRLGDMRLFQRNVTEALDSSPHGVFLLDDAATVRFVNRAAEALMARTAGLTVSGGRLTCPRADAARRLQALIASAASSEATLEKGGKMRLAPVGLRLPLTLTVAPYPREGPALCGRGGVIVWVTDPTPDGDPSPAALAERYGLTPAERRVALALLDGVSPREAADRLGVSFHTVRNQLRSLYAKTGAKRQSDLVRRLLGDVGPPSA